MVATLLAARLILPFHCAAAETGDGTQVEELSLELSLNKNRVYPGESLTATVTLLAGQVPVRNIQYPVLKGGPYKLSEFAPPRSSGFNRDGHDYTAHEFTAALTMFGSGEFRIGPAELGCDILVPEGGASTFFGGGEPKAVKLRSPPVSLVVLPLPPDGRPANFNGAVGRFKVSRQALSKPIRSGDPVTVTTRIEGTGNMDAFSCQPIELPNVRSYPPRTQRAAHRLSCEQVLIPERESSLTIPGAAISFFDPLSARYRSIDSGPVHVEVTGGSAPAVTARKPLPTYRQEFPLCGVGSECFYIVLVSSLLLFILLVYLLMRRRSRGQARTAFISSTHIGHAAWLAEAKNALESNDPVRFHTAIFRVLQAYLGTSFGLPATAITGEIVAKILQPAGLPEHLLDSYEKLFLTCDRARFSPDGKSGAAMRDTYNLLAWLMKQD